MSAPHLERALAARDPSARLQAALAAGTTPDPDDAPVLIGRCAIESDFYVREMLTWALTRHPAGLTVPLLLAELDSAEPQARSQALHTLSKIGDPRAWPAISDELLRHPDEEVARAAWRTAAGLVPPGEEGRLASRLVTQLGRGEPDIWRSLGRALALLGDAAAPALREAADGTGIGNRAEGVDDRARLHAATILRMLEDPALGFDAALYEAEQEAQAT